MADVSFVHVSAEGFTAFSAQLDNAPWSAIDVSTYLGANGRLRKPVGTASAFVLLKIQLLLAVSDVVSVLQSTSGAKGYDEAWDRAQKRLAGLIAVARMSVNDPEREAADRLHNALLLGKNGDRQTRLAYQHEVDFGRNQLRLAAETQNAVDIALLGLGTVMAHIATATEDLATAVSRGRGDLAPAEQRKVALVKCVQVFGTVYRMLSWMAEFGDAEDREQALELQASLENLALRYPARESKPKTTTKLAPVVVARGP